MAAKQTFDAARHTLPEPARLERILSLPRVTLGTWPTPVQKVRLTDGNEVLVKRDDLSGYGRGGAKARKIEGLIGHMLDRGYDHLVTLAGNVTNLVFDILPALDTHGITADLLIANDPPIDLKHREQVFASVRNRVRLMGTSRAQAAWDGAAAYRRARARGQRPMLVLPGVSHPSAVAANARGFVEMARQLDSQDVGFPETVFVSAATGTTIAGFAIGAALLREAGGPHIRLVGVQVYPGPIGLTTWALVRWTERWLGMRPLVRRKDIEIDASALGGGFGHFPARLQLVCENVSRGIGITIDPIFGGKTWAAMETRMADRRGGPLLYWHCGYTPEWRTLAAFVAQGTANL